MWQKHTKKATVFCLSELYIFKCSTMDSPCFTGSCLGGAFSSDVRAGCTSCTCGRPWGRMPGGSLLLKPSKCCSELSSSACDVSSKVKTVVNKLAPCWLVMFYHLKECSMNPSLVHNVYFSSSTVNILKRNYILFWLSLQKIQFLGPNT